jgi:hypothetical protein
LLTVSGCCVVSHPTYPAATDWLGFVTLSRIWHGAPEHLQVPAAIFFSLTTAITITLSSAATTAAIYRHLLLSAFCNKPPPPDPPMLHPRTNHTPIRPSHCYYTPYSITHFETSC